MPFSSCFRESPPHMRVDIAVAIGASPFLPDCGEVTQQRASCCRDQVYQRNAPPPPHSLQKQQPAAASVSSDLLNLPHFNHDSAPLLSSHGSLARIPKPPAASSRRSSLSGVSRPVSQPARRGLELRKGRKEGEKKTAFSIDGPLFIYITSNDHGGDPLSRDAPNAESRGLEKQTHPDTVKHTVSSSRRLN